MKRVAGVVVVLAAITMLSVQAADLSFNYTGGFGSLGASWPLGGTIRPYNANENPTECLFGAEFAGPTRIDSLTLYQITDPNAEPTPRVRNTINKMSVYADGMYVGYVLVSNVTNPTVNFRTDLLIDGDNGPTQVTTPLVASWLTFRVLSKHGTDPNTGLAYRDQGGTMSYTFAGTQLGTDNNINLGKTATLTTALPTINKDGSRAVDGCLTRTNGSLDYISFGVDGGSQSNRVTQFEMTVDYAGVGYDVRSVGIALKGSVSAPKWVLITDSYGNEVTVWLERDQLQYNRYNLTNEEGKLVEFLNTKSLTITFPVGYGCTNGTKDDWHTSGNWDSGLVEFQAFSNYWNVPEPATMSLLALGGLALLRRRK